MTGTKKWVITALIAFSIGYFAALWVTYLDPDGTGGSILAMPAIAAILIATALAVVMGLSSIRTGHGRYFFLSVLLIPIAFLVSTILVR